MQARGSTFPRRGRIVRRSDSASLRDAGPSPPTAFCSFLATAVVPLPQPRGRGLHRAGSLVPISGDRGSTHLFSLARCAGGPHPRSAFARSSQTRATPPKLRGRGGEGGLVRCGSAGWLHRAIEFSLFPRSSWGKGRDGRRPVAACPSAGVKFNLPQGSLGEVGELSEPGGGAAGVQRRAGRRTIGRTWTMRAVPSALTITRCTSGSARAPSACSAAGATLTSYSPGRTRPR